MYLYFRRILDILLSFIVLIITLPITVPIIVVLKLTGEGEVFYLQERVGFKNKLFLICKFATMLKNSPNIGNKGMTVRNDPRITKFGKFLRQAKLNELPQVINVLKGDMSLIGPRPLMPAGFRRFSKKVQSEIYSIRPGITGIGSVIFRDEEEFVTRNTDYVETYDYINSCKGELESWYRTRIGFFTDCAILFLTAWVIVFPKSELPYKIFTDLPRFERYTSTLRKTF